MTVKVECLHCGATCDAESEGHELLVSWCPNCNYLPTAAEMARLRVVPASRRGER